MAKKTNPQYRVGIDLGGTKMHAVVIDEKGRVLATARRATKPELGYGKVLKRIGTTIEEVCEAAKLKIKQVPVVGLGMPGPIDTEKGVVHIAPNLGWEKKPVAKDVEKIIGCPVVLGNDVNFGALGEATYGVAQGTSSSFSAFVGTGLGGGYILKNKLVNGAYGFAGEIGHMRAPFQPAPCKCGLTGCLETFASKTGLLRLIDEQKKKGVKCLLEMSAEEKPKSSHLRDAYKNNCPATHAAMEQASEALAWGLASVAATLDPEVFVLGGGVVEALGKEMRKQVYDHFSTYSLLYHKKKPDIRLAALGDDAVAIGAAVAGSQQDA
jgi:glucokinase